MADVGFHFDEAGGRLRAPVASVELLGRQEEMPDIGLDLQPLADAISQALLRVELHLRGLGASSTGVGWIGRELSVLVLPQADDPDGPSEVIACASAALPHRLAEVVELGPRPTDMEAGLVVVEREVLEELSCRLKPPGAAEAREALAADDNTPEAWLESMVAPFAVHWRVTIRASDGAAQSFERVCEVLDAGASGLLSITDLPDAPGLVALAPVTATMVWNALSTVLPTVEEMNELHPDPTPA